MSWGLLAVMAVLAVDSSGESAERKESTELQGVGTSGQASPAAPIFAPPAPPTSVPSSAPPPANGTVPPVPPANPPAYPPAYPQYPYPTYPWYPPPGYSPYPWYPPPGYPRPPQQGPAPAQAPPTPAPQTETPTVETRAEPDTGAFPARTSWALQLESAQGVGTGKFNNVLLAGHLDYAFASRLGLGGYLAVANLKGKDRRVSALMPCALVTYEKPPGPGHSVSFPLQFATGYLAGNGPVARLSVGMAWAAGQHADIIPALAAMAWVTHDQMLLSVNLALELRFRRGQD